MLLHHFENQQTFLFYQNVCQRELSKHVSFCHEIYYLDKVVSIDEKNPRVLEQLSDIYGQTDRYEEQIEIIDLWLKLELDEMSYKKAIGEKKNAYLQLGK